MVMTEKKNRKKYSTPPGFIDVVHNETHIHTTLHPCATNAGTHEEPAAGLTRSNLWEENGRGRPRKSMVW